MAFALHVLIDADRRPVESDCKIMTLILVIQSLELLPEVPIQEADKVLVLLRDLSENKSMIVVEVSVLCQAFHSSYSRRQQV